MQTKEKLICLKPSPANKKGQEFGRFRVGLEVKSELQGCLPMVDYR